jgi:hypothetical protein
MLVTLWVVDACSLRPATSAKKITCGTSWRAEQQPAHQLVPPVHNSTDIVAQLTKERGPLYCVDCRQGAKLRAKARHWHGRAWQLTGSLFAPPRLPAISHMAHGSCSRRSAAGR